MTTIECGLLVHHAQGDSLKRLARAIGTDVDTILADEQSLVLEESARRSRRSTFRSAPASSAHAWRTPTTRSTTP
jgi:hypothetical protein